MSTEQEQEEDHTKHLEYLERMVTKNVVSSGLAVEARLAWEAARQTIPELSLPVATACKGGPIHYWWDNGRRTASLEFHDDCVEWYVSDRNRNDSSGGECPYGAALPELFLNGLAALAKGRQT